MTDTAPSTDPAATPADASTTSPDRVATPNTLVISMWPTPATPEFGCFVRAQVEALINAGNDINIAPLTDSRSGRLRTPLKYLQLRTAAIRTARALHSEVVHGHYLVPTGYIACNVARKLKLPLVVTAHGTDVRNAETMPKVRERTETVVRSAAAVIAVSRDLADRIAALYPGVIAHVIDMGIDTAVFYPPRAAASAATPHVVAVGNLLPNKNHGRLIDAFVDVPEARLTIVGAGQCRSELSAQIQRLGLGDRVTLAGRLPRDEVADLLRSADVATLISIDEGFGLSALEAAACGARVVVAGGVPAGSVLVEHGAGVSVEALDIPAITAAIQSALAAGRLDPQTAAQVVTGRDTASRAREVAAVLTAVATSAATA